MHGDFTQFKPTRCHPLVPRRHHPHIATRASPRRRHGDRTSPSLATATTATQRARTQARTHRPQTPHPVRRPRDSCRAPPLRLLSYRVDTAIPPAPPTPPKFPFLVISPPRPPSKTNRKPAANATEEAETGGGKGQSRRPAASDRSVSPMRCPARPRRVPPR